MYNRGTTDDSMILELNESKKSYSVNCVKENLFQGHYAFINSFWRQLNKKSHKWCVRQSSRESPMFFTKILGYVGGTGCNIFHDLPRLAKEIFSPAFMTFIRK